MAWLEYTDAEGRVRKVEIPKTPAGIVIGRSNACQVVLKSPLVGRNHGKVLYQDGVYIYKDLGSVNGSYVNERKVQGDVALKDGDLIRLGDVLVRFLGEQRADEPRVQAGQKAAGARVAGTDALSLVEVVRLRRENEALRAELAALERRLKEQGSKDVSEIERRLAGAEEALKEREDEVRHLKGLLADSERRLRESEARVGTLSSSLESVHSKYLDMREQAAHAQRLLEQARQEASEKEMEVAELREKVAMLEAQLEAARSRTGQSVEEAKNLKVKVTEKDREIERLKRELDIREYDLRALREENERLQEYCASDSGRQRELERKIRNLEAVIEDNRNLIEELRRMIAERDRELMAARLGVGLANLEQEKQRLLDDFHKKAREVDELRAEVAALTAEIGAARAEAEGYRVRIKQLEEASRIRKSEREDISDHPEYKARVREAERLRGEMEVLAREIEALRRDALLPEERARLLAELEASQEKIRLLQVRLAETEAEMRRARESSEAAEWRERIVERLETILDDVRVLQTEARDVVSVFERLERSGQTIEDLSLSEIAESLQALLRVLARDAEGLEEALRNHKGG